MTMSDQATATVEAPVTTRKAAETRRRPRRQSPYQVLLWDDDDHTYDYVIEMLRKLFGHVAERAFCLAEEVDTTGRTIVDTTTKERAELKRDQIHAYGPDWRIPRCKGSMSSTIEPVDDGG